MITNHLFPVAFVQRLWLLPVFSDTSGIAAAIAAVVILINKLCVVPAEEALADGRQARGVGARGERGGLWQPP